MSNTQGIIIAKGEKSLAIPDVLRTLITDIKSYYGRSKLDVQYLANAIQRPASHKEDIARHVSTSLKAMDTKEVLGIWNSCNRHFKALILIQDDNILDLELYRHLGLVPVAIYRAYMYQRSKSPEESPYSTHYTDFDYNSGAELVKILSELEKEEAMEVVREMDVKVLYLIASMEAEGFLQNDMHDGVYFYTAMRSNDRLPPGLPFLQWMQENVHEEYAHLIGELENRTWPELREMFYETFHRTHRSKASVDEKDTAGDDSYMNRLLNND